MFVCFHLVSDLRSRSILKYYLLMSFFPVQTYQVFTLFNICLIFFPILPYHIRYFIILLEFLGVRSSDSNVSFTSYLLCDFVHVIYRFFNCSSLRLLWPILVRITFWNWFLGQAKMHHPFVKNCNSFSTPQLIFLNGQTKNRTEYYRFRWCRKKKMQ